ncbi:MAG: DNA polymerase ligase N-terminal domain-containing protein [Gemmataceae bacterium]
MPRFVLLEHDHPFLHYDLMIEVGDVLWTWRLDVALPTGERLAASRIADHRRAYLDYEGPVSGNRGTVRRVDGGEYDWVERQADCLVLQVRGRRAVGRLVLRRTGDEEWEAELVADSPSLAEGEGAGQGG